MTQKTKIYYYIVGTIFSIIGIVIIYRFIASLSESETPVFNVKKEYLELFNDTTRNQLKKIVSYNSKKRNSIAILGYNKEKYGLMIYKIPVDKGFSLKSDVSVKQEDNEFHSGSVYTTINESYFEVFYASGKPEVAKELHLSYNGNSFQTVISNDSISLFYFKYKNLALRYNNERTIDIHSRVGNIYPPVPVSVLFLKRDDAVYFVMMSVGSPNANLDPKLLYTIIK